MLFNTAAFAWFLLLVAVLVGNRGGLTMGGKRAANNFKPDGSDMAPFLQRLTRAHANCYENLPAFAALILVAIVTGHAEVTGPLACWVVGARVAQSTVHLVSTSVPAVMVRFTFFLVQIGIEIWWTVGLYRALSA